MADFPFSESDGVQYDGPTLFVRGTKSKYVTDATIPAIKRFFPNAQIADVEAGHWLISEKPEDFRQGNYSNSDLIHSMAKNMTQRLSSSWDRHNLHTEEEYCTVPQR